MGGSHYYDYESSGDQVTPTRLNEPWEPTDGSARVPGIHTDIENNNLEVQDSNVIRANLQLTGSVSDGFPNTTTTYIWNFDSAADGNQTDVVGSKVLTRAGANALTAAADVLGVSRYNTCGADTELTSTDTAFNIANTADTDDFIYGGWFCLPDWTPAGTVLLMSNTTDASNHGFGLQYEATGQLDATLWGATDTNAITNLANCAANSYHHIVHAREVGVAQYLFVDGILVATGADTTIGTTQTKFQISGYAHSNACVAETGTRFDEIFFRKGVLPTNLPDVVRNIYARSAKKFSVKSQDNGVVVVKDIKEYLKNSTGIAINNVNGDIADSIQNSSLIVGGKVYMGGTHATGPANMPFGVIFTSENGGSKVQLNYSIRTNDSFRGGCQGVYLISFWNSNDGDSSIGIFTLLKSGGGNYSAQWSQLTGSGTGAITLTQSVNNTTDCSGYLRQNSSSTAYHAWSVTKIGCGGGNAAAVTTFSVSAF